MTRGVAGLRAPAVRRPGPWSLLLVRTAVLLLPAAERARYRQELVAELYGLEPRRQRAQAAGVLVHAGALRAALARDGREEDTMTTTRKPVRCLLGRHRWHWESTEDGGRFRRCLRCGVDAGGPGGDDGPGDWIGPIGGIQL